MKKFLVIILGMILPTLNIYSQNYIPFPSDSTEWLIEMEGFNAEGGSSSFFKFEYSVHGDTVINDTTFIKLYKSGESYSDIYIYQDTIERKVYYKQLNWSDGILLFDFSLDVGDYFDLTEIGSLLVSAVDTVEIAGLKRRVITLDYPLHAAARINNSPLLFIEGIGSNAGIFVTSYLGLIATVLTCYNAENIQYSLITHDDACNPDKIVINTGIHENEYPSVSIYPNPVVNDLYLTTISEVIQEVELYNITGTLIYRESYNLSHEIVIDFTDYPSGIYFVAVKGENGNLARKILKN